MPYLNHGVTIKSKTGWFDRQSHRTRAFLLALLMFATSAVTFLLGFHDWRAGEPVVDMAGRSDWSDMFLCSAGTFALGAVLFAVAMSWIRFPQKEASQPQPPVQQK